MAQKATVTYRMAEEGDIGALAELFDMANHGDIAVIWGREAGPGETWKDICARHMRNPGSEIHIDKTVVAIVDGAVAGMLMFFRASPPREYDLTRLPVHARPFMILRAQAPECVYLRDMAVFPQFRGHGIAKNMLDLAIAVGFARGLKHACAIVHETNTKLLAHYYKRGMVEIAREQVLEHNLHAPESYWLLLKLDAPETPAAAPTADS